MDTDRTVRPNTLPWPPMILAGTLAAALVLEWLVPTRLPLPPLLGWATMAAALGLDVWAMATMARARTNILPHRAADQLVTTGPFGLSRNPIYVGNVLLLLGLAVGLGSLWMLAAAAVDALATHRLAVLREERHLAARFGDAWTAYAARTPRWIGLPSR